jgi:thiol-disulfide isomerase/thioredoxin
MRRRIDQPIRIRFVGRLSALTIGALALVVVVEACNDKKPPPVTNERSQAVTATGPARTAPPVASPTPSATVKKPPRKLCAGELDKAGEAFPDKAISRATVPGAPELGARPKVGGGNWTWVNFWAAWCVPCKEEMPRLKAFEKKLKEAGKPFQVVFVSLDDDQRQLDEFMKAQPETGMRASFWLKEGKEREEWMGAAKLETDPELPTHLVVDKQGKIRCRVKGAVEDSDYASLLEIVGS